MDVRPVQKGERIEHIDAIRGFAIFGIFMVNIGAFSAPYFLYGGAEDAWDSPVDQTTMAIVDIFFQGSFYTLFSLLFGFSWQLMKDRLTVKAMEFSEFLVRRQVVLIGFGAVHAFLIWHGDILLSYGLIGLILPFFMKVKDRTLLAWAASLMLGSVSLLTLGLYQVRHLLNVTAERAIETAIANYSSGRITDILSQNFHDWSMANSLFSYIFLAGILLPLFLVGMYLARKRWFHEPDAYRHILWRMFTITLILSVILKSGPYVIGNPLWLSYIQDNLGGTASALFYMTSLALLSHTAAGRKLLQPFKYVGRMALSNYIFQSIVSFILFYNVGLGLYHSVTPTVSVMLVLIIFTGQLFLSKWWLSRYRYGPLEWLWRSMNYKKMQPFRK